MQSEERIHQVYLLTRKSDSQQYVGITIKDRFDKRIYCHKISERFKGDDFDTKILAESTNRSKIEELEEYFIKYYDTYNNGLNDSESGKGYGHNDPKFTTLGYKFTNEQRQRMSEAGKKRALREGFETRSKRSKAAWENEEYRKKQIEIRKNKRLRPPKISDEDVVKIRERFHSMKEYLEKETFRINEARHSKNPSWKKTNKERVFANMFHKEYGVSSPALYGIVSYKTRTKVLPSLCKY